MDSNVSGVINALTPIFTLIVGFVLFQKKPSKLAILGIFLGFLGVFMIIASRGFSSVNLIVAGLPLVSTFFYGINTNLMKEKIPHLTSIQMLSCFYGILFIPSIFFLMYNDTFRGVSLIDFSPCFWHVTGSLASQKMNSIVAVLTLGVVGTTATSLIFYFLLKRTNILFATMTTFLIPIVSLFWGYIDGELISLLQIISLITILSGVYLVSRYSK
jgi:drug/metabolite transporter (DMT)-like permease